MSELTERVAREHVLYRRTEDTSEVVWGARVPRFVGYGCECGWTTGDATATATSLHMADVTEAAVREAIAADITNAVLPAHPNTGYRDGIARAARIARGET